MVHGILKITCSFFVDGGKVYQFQTYPLPILLSGSKSGASHSNTTEEVGKDVGNNLDRYIETDKRSWLSEQAKFMRVRVDLPIDKPL